MDLGKRESLTESSSPETFWLWIAGLAPCIAVLLGLYAWESAWGSILLLHLTMVLLPAYLTRCGAPDKVRTDVAQRVLGRRVGAAGPATALWISSHALQSAVDDGILPCLHHSSWCQSPLCSRAAYLGTPRDHLQLLPVFMSNTGVYSRFCSVFFSKHQADCESFARGSVLESLFV